MSYPYTTILYDRHIKSKSELFLVFLACDICMITHVCPCGHESMCVCGDQGDKVRYLPGNSTQVDSLGNKSLSTELYKVFHVAYSLKMHE